MLSQVSGFSQKRPTYGGPGYRIEMGSTPFPICSKRNDHPMGGHFFWSRIRESNPPSRLGKPLYYRYTNPAGGDIIADPPEEFNHYLSSHFQRKIQQKHGRSSEKNSAMFDMVTNRQIEAISVQNRFSSTRR